MRRFVRFLPYALFLALTLPWIRAMPIWDGMYYFDCVLRATAPPYPFSAFSCADHPPGYLLLAGFPQYFVHGSAVALNLSNIAWMLVGIAGVARLLALVGAERTSRLEQALAAAVFASAPLVVAVTYHFAADAGLLAFFPWVLDGLLRRRTVQALVAGTVLVLAKEPGLGLYAIAWVVALALDWRGIRNGDRVLLRRVLFLVWPFLAAVVYVAIRSDRGFRLINEDAQLNAGLGAATWGGLGIMLVLSFAWLLWSVPLAAWLVQRVRGRPEARLAPIERGLVFVLVAVVAMLTRFVPYRNPRYFVTALVPLLAVAFVLLARSTPRAFRIAFLSGLIVLNVAANGRTLDPVSIAAFGAARYGAMPMHCRYWEPDRGCWGRDQVVYNQQFLEVQAAQTALFRALRPDSGTTFVVAPDATYFMHGPLDADSFERTARSRKVVTPRFVTAPELLARPVLPEAVYVLNYPRLGFSGVPRLESCYHVVSREAYGTARLPIPVTVMRRNATGTCTPR